MVMSFFRKGESGMEHIAAQAAAMLGDARHSFDLACSTVFAGADLAQATTDIEATDRRINATEAEIRRELIVHVSVRGNSDIGQVLGYTLLVKKIERIGDQAKNILDLATEGISFAEAADLPTLLESQRAISSLFADVVEFLVDPTDGALAELQARAEALHRDEARRIRELMHSPEPGSYAVPRAILHRYLKRIVANLNGIATTVGDPATLLEPAGDEPED